jgi:hypothetical protein
MFQERQRLSCSLSFENSRMLETGYANTALIIEFEKFKYVDYEDPAMPQFQMTPDDFPPLISDNISKIIFVNAAFACNNSSTKPVTASVDIDSSVQDMIDLPLDTGFVEDKGTATTATTASTSSCSLLFALTCVHVYLYLG